MNRLLPAKIAVITGGSTGIGLAIAKKFVAEGASVFITGRQRAELDLAVAEIGRPRPDIKRLNGPDFHGKTY